VSSTHAERAAVPTIALVLAAGFGTRLQPFTAHTPKPLFTLNGQPLLDIMIRRLTAAGVGRVIVNTHHHHDKIAAFLRPQAYTAEIVVRHEPQILGTGGAIRNTADLWQGRTLLVVNSDIVADIDFQRFYRFHRGHGRPVSLVLCAHEAFNTVAVDRSDRVIGFQAPPEGEPPSGDRRLTFTGVQLVEDDILDFLPEAGFASSIDAFQAMMAAGRIIKAYRPAGLYWSDLGTPERYRAEARAVMAPAAFRQAGLTAVPQAAEWQPLPGDGSDRRWYRLTAGDATLIAADHGIKPTADTCEAESFVAIGRHLHRCGAPVPKIFLADTFAGLVFMEDLGDENLQDRVRARAHAAAVEADYRRVIDMLLEMAAAGGEGFDPAWAYQTPRYDRGVVLEKECRYFVDAFLNGYLALAVPFERLAPECRRLADAVAAVRPLGFMHRDFQSRNIMVHGGRFYAIDFQAGRSGPPHYDLAALLIDPYVDLPDDLRARLLAYFTRRLSARAGIPDEAIRRDYAYCALARNLQILGAYGFLTRRRNKPFFAQFIPAAVRSLQQGLSAFGSGSFPELSRLAARDIPRRLAAS
jgi:aminoglycoside/choline kinase family phosphotransferase/molybdopterin-guanine dinucleotide biosynthesis protein A